LVLLRVPPLVELEFFKIKLRGKRAEQCFIIAISHIDVWTLVDRINQTIVPKGVIRSLDIKLFMSKIEHDFLCAMHCNHLSGVSNTLGGYGNLF